VGLHAEAGAQAVDDEQRRDLADARLLPHLAAQAPSGDGFRRCSSDCPAALPEKPKGFRVELAVDPQRETM
jgi:hypothetical protein